MDDEWRDVQPTATECNPNRLENPKGVMCVRNVYMSVLGALTNVVLVWECIIYFYFAHMWKQVHRVHTQRTQKHKCSTLLTNVICRQFTQNEAADASA